MGGDRERGYREGGKRGRKERETEWATRRGTAGWCAWKGRSSRFQAGHALTLSSSRVMGPVVSCEPTVVMPGSQYVPGGTPSPAGRPHARPTIFCARV